MKRAIQLLLSIVLIFNCISCSEETLDYNNPNVKLFVKQLKAGRYNTTNDNGVVDIPKFTQKHIPELLKYAEDMTEISSFPLPSMPSHYGGRARLGECMLWVIEGIRLGYPPSQGCKLLHKDADAYEGIYFLTNEQVLEVAVLYRKWWEKVENPNPIWSIDLLAYDPLRSSDYRWW